MLADDGQTHSAAEASTLTRMLPRKSEYHHWFYLMDLGHTEEEFLELSEMAFSQDSDIVAEALKQMARAIKGNYAGADQALFEDIIDTNLLGGYLPSQILARNTVLNNRDLLSEFLPIVDELESLQPEISRDNKFRYLRLESSSKALTDLNADVGNWNSACEAMPQDGNLLGCQKMK